MDKLRKLALEEAHRCTYDRVEYLGYRNGRYDEKRNVKLEKTFLYANMLLE